MKALVVDDEAPARRRLARMLQQLPDVEVSGQLEDGDAVLRALESAAHPDVVFLDVRMPGLDGLSLVQRYAELPPIVFVTAYEQYAVQAFEVNAVDYLLKPVRQERLAAALERVRSRQLADRDAISRALAAARPVAPLAIPRVVSSARGVIRLFDARDITRFWASEKYTVFRADGADQLTEEPLSALESRLAPHGFLRVHRAELVRADAIRALRSDAGFHAISLCDGQDARVSRRSLGAIKAALGLA